MVMVPVITIIWKYCTEAKISLVYEEILTLKITFNFILFALSNNRKLLLDYCEMLFD